MQCYTELTPPTAVTHSLTLPFISAQRDNLVVARGSLLQIFTTKSVSAELDQAQNSQGQPSFPSRQAGRYDVRINDDEGLEASFLGGDASLVRADQSTHTKLVLVAEFPLPGSVIGLARVKKADTKSGGDALLLGCRDAKLSMVEWDPDKHNLYTTSIHYYEQEELQKEPWALPLGHYVNYLSADPGSRCAALKFGSRSLAILLFNQADEDVEMEDWDEELDGPRPAKELATTFVDGTSNNQDTPYSTSFVLRLPNLDPNLLHPVHLAFLHEYRDPTFGILSSTMAPSAALARKDHLCYTVFTLDLKQKASTTILSVTALPQDLFRVVVIPAPVGGALLVGSNELIHIDQSGKAHGVAVNPFAKQTTSFSLVDQSDLGLRLEHCEIEIITAEYGELLMVLSDGGMVLITFRIDGRTVAGFDVRPIPRETGGLCIPNRVTTLSRIAPGCIFAGSEDGDSLVIGWSKKQQKSVKKRNHPIKADLGSDVDDEELLDLEDDDLYADDSALLHQTPVAPKVTTGLKAAESIFKIHDRLASIAPIRGMVMGRTSAPDDYSDTPGSTADPTAITSDLSLVCAVGRGQSGALALINREVQPQVIGKFEFPEARSIWTLSARKSIPKSLQGDKGARSVGADFDTCNQYDTFMIVSKIDLDGYETSDVYALTGAGFESLAGTEFDPAAGFTIEAGTMGGSMRIIQVLKAEVRCYDGDFGLSQIVPMLDEETGAEPRIICASIADPYLLLVRDDASVCVIKIDRQFELEEMEKDDKVLTSMKWVAGCLYKDTGRVFARAQAEKNAKPDENIVMSILSNTGALYIYALPDLRQPIFVIEGLSYIPPLLSAGYSPKKGSAKEAITEILIADLGDSTSSSPFLIVRHTNDDLTIYQPFRTASQDASNLIKCLRFQKISNDRLAKSPIAIPEDETENLLRKAPLRRCTNVGGYKTVFLPGFSPSFLVKSSKTLPRILGLQGAAVRSMSSFHTEGCERGFIYADQNGIARVCQLSTQNTTYAEIGMSLRKVPFQTDIGALAYHNPSCTYTVGCNQAEPFELPKDDDYRREWQSEKNLIFKPTMYRGVIRLVNPLTWTVIDGYELEPCESIMCVETLNLEVSETTNERKHLVVVGTAISRGEDLPIRGRILVFDVVDVIPEPGRPETNKRLKLIAKEEIPRGAVTALSEIGTQGLMLVAQGTKCMVRGLKEDGSLLPVAFMDMSCYVTSVCELKGTGLCLMSDAGKGVWFTGYTEEPYKMILFGKSASVLEIATANFLPDVNELAIIACDPDGGVHILQFDPEHPKSLGGHLLLYRTTFSTGAHIPNQTLLLPRTLPPGHEIQLQPGQNNGVLATPPQPKILLLSSATGLLATLAPLSEQDYRRLSSLASHLTTSLAYPAGLNPKAYRTSAGGVTGTVGRQPPAIDAGIGRAVVDGALLGRWNELGAGRRAEIAGRVGFAGVGEVRTALEGLVGGSGLMYI